MDLRVFISGVEYRCTDRYSIQEQAGAVSISDFPVRLDDNPAPVSLALLQVKDSLDNVFYSGIIQSVAHPVYSTQYETKIYRVQCASLNCVLNWRLVSEAFEDKYTHEIVASLFTTYLVPEGITLGTIVNSTRKYEKYTANRRKLSDCLTELGDAIGAIPVITPDKVFHFIDKNTFMQATVPTHITKLSKSDDGSELRTVQFLSGASEKTGIQTTSIVWAAGQAEISLGYQVSSVIGISINSTPCGVGVQGIDSDDASKTFLYKFGLTSIALNAVATVKPATGDTVAVAYYGYYAIEVETTNEDLKSQISSLNGLSGRIEVSEIDTTITSFADGESAANDLLTMNGIRDDEVTVVCHDVDNSQCLMAWDLTYTRLGITGQFVVTERTITDLYDQFHIQLKLRNRRFYSRYGTVYNRNQRTINNLTIRPDDVIGKYSNYSETVTFADAFALDNAGVIYYPTDGTNLADPQIGDMYPI